MPGRVRFSIFFIFISLYALLVAFSTTANDTPADPILDKILPKVENILPGNKMDEVEVGREDKDAGETEENKEVGEEVAPEEVIQIESEHRKKHHKPKPKKKKRALKIRRLDRLSFGQFSIIGNGGITIHPENGRRTIHGDVYIFGGHYHPATYRVRGKPGTMIEITLPDSIELYKNGRHHSANIDLIQLTSFPESPTIIGEDGVVVVHVGGQLIVDGNTPSGTYEGVFDIYVRPID